MSLYYVLLIFGIIALAFWLVYRFASEPPKTVLLWVLSIALVAWVLQLMGFWAWIAGVKV